MKLAGEGCIVTGGRGALGAAVVNSLRAAGAAVAILDRGPMANGRSLVFGGVDLTDPAATQRAVDAAAHKLGGLYALVNAAGAFRWEKIGEGEIATWDLLYSANLKTALCASKAALPHLRANGRGRIVNIGAAAAAKPGEGMGAYAASKAGVAKFTQALSEEVKGEGVTVNAILPSIVDTPANRRDMPQADFGKWVSAQSIAALIAFLLCDEAQDITGALIPVTGRM